MESLEVLFPNLDFYDDAKDDWEHLDGHQKKFVSKALARIEERGSEIGEPLGNKRNIDLTNYRKVKLRQIGIRIVYRVANDAVEITEIVAIGDRDDEQVYLDAYERIQKQKRQTTDSTTQ